MDELRGLLGALRDGAGGSAGLDALRRLAELTGGDGDLDLLAARAARASEDPALRGPFADWAAAVRRALTGDPEAVARVARAMDRHTPGSGAALYAGDSLSFDGLFLGDVVGTQVNVRPAAPPTAHESLPPKASGFTGREAELERLLAELDPGRESGNPTPVVVVSGLGGVGKTALAVVAGHTAHERGWFPGGTFFIDLHGYDETPGSADLALESLLHALGVRAEQVPKTLDDRSALFRTVLAERVRSVGTVLIVADNAFVAEQVRPLLPGHPGHRVLVTSRSRLSQLDARLLPLAELSTAGATDLLDRALRIADSADDRVDHDPAAAAELARLCGHLPLALRISAGLLAGDPGVPVAGLVAELVGSPRLRVLEDGDQSVGACFDLSYQRLPADQARVLRLLALAPTAEGAEEAIAALVDGDPPTAELRGLLRTHLVERTGVPGRWRLHDLVREYAAGAAGTAEEQGARARVLRFYADRAAVAARHLHWVGPQPLPGVFESRDRALGWLVTEQANLLAAVGWTGREGCAVLARGLAGDLWLYLDWRGYFRHVARSLVREDAVTEGPGQDEQGFTYHEGTTEAAIEARVREIKECRTRGDSKAEAWAWNALGSLWGHARLVDRAMGAHGHAVYLFETADDMFAAAYAWNNLGTTLYENGRLQGSLEAHTRARDLFQQVVGDRYREAWAWTNLGTALSRLGRREEQAQALSAALELYSGCGDSLLAAHTLRNLALSVAAQGDAEAARANWARAADAYARVGANAYAVCARAAAMAEPPADLESPPAQDG
ncbi:tetratricopeptide repeat protein [Streptomyces sp. NPDC047061]|uniref:tetratricopeptide repeat protein n=1 Tax=Streptomyces sp. NPDC047061 TaxID=3154605 RepID=UPI0033FD51A8